MWKCRSCELKSSVFQLWPVVCKVVADERNITALSKDVESKVLEAATKQESIQHANATAPSISPYVDKPTVDCLPVVPEEEDVFVVPTSEESWTAEEDEGEDCNRYEENANLHHAPEGGMHGRN
jgi:hypothetical protein